MMLIAIGCMVASWAVGEWWLSPRVETYLLDGHLEKVRRDLEIEALCRELEANLELQRELIGQMAASAARAIALLRPRLDVVRLGSYVGAAPKTLTESTDAVRFPGLGEHSSCFASSIEGHGGCP